MIHAYRGIGKTFFALEIALAIAAGAKFLHWHAPKAARVLYLDGEMQAIQLQERIRLLSHRFSDWERDNLRLMPCGIQRGPMPDLSLQSAQRALNQHLKGIDLIVVDNISSLCRTGAENEAESWRPVQDWLLVQRNEGRSVLLIHHAGKGGTQRGTSKREDVLDTVINLKRPAEYTANQGARFEVHFEKARGFAGDDAKAMIVQLVKNEAGELHWESDSLEETTFEKVVGMLNEGVDQNQIAEQLQVNKSTVSRHVKQAREQGLLGSQTGRISQSTLI